MDTHQEDTDTDIITNQEALQENFNGTGKATSEEIPDQRTSGIGSTITVECSSQMEDTVRERSTDQPDVPISTENEPVVQLSNQPGTPDCAVQCSASDREPDAQGNVSPSSQLAELPQVQGEVEEGDGGLMEVAMVAGVGSKGASMSCMASPEQPEAAMTEQTEEKREEREREESSAARYTLSGGLHQVTKSWKTGGANNYFRGCKWAPDGSCILTCSNDNKMRLFNLPAELCSPNKPNAQELPELAPALTVPLRESVYDFCWYPRMSSWNSETCCFLTSCKDHPIHLWDAFHHRNRASYVPYNHLDEVVSSYSLAFSVDGERIFAGLSKSVQIFHLSRPGRDSTTISTYNKKTGGQSGIISCIAMCPAVPRLYALGSYSCSIGVYSEDAKGAILVLSGVNSGVTHMMFSQDGQTLYTGFRKDDMIVGWDLRNPGEAVCKMERVVDTNQRIYFDSSSDGRYLVSGGTDGRVYGWDVSGHGGERGRQQEGEGEKEKEDKMEELEDSVLKPSLSYQAHTDAVNGVSVHPSLPLLATCSGQRQFTLPGEEEDSSSSSDQEEVETHSCTSTEMQRSLGECDLKIWQIVPS